MSHARNLASGSIADHFRALAVPAAVGMVFSTLYNVVDVWFAGRVDTGAQAGLAVAYQVFFLLISMGIGLGSAMGALVGGEIGRGDLPLAERFAAQGLVLGIAASVVLTALGFAFGPLVIEALTADGRYRDYATDYLTLLMIAAPAFILAFGANGILQAQGDTVSMQHALIAAFFANVVLNPILVWGIPGLIPGLGFNGIALSTVASQIGVMAFILWRVATSPLGRSLSRAHFRPAPEDLRAIAVQMLPATFALVVMIFSGFLIQLYLKSFGEPAVAAYGIALRIEQLFLLPVFGLTAALLPIAAANYGAGLAERVRQSVLACWRFGFLFMAVACPVLWLGAPYLMRVFTQDAEVVEIGIGYLHVDGVLLPAYMVLFSINSFLQALRKPLWTLWIGLYRQAFGVAVFVWIFVRVLDFGVPGVWFGIAASVLSGLLLALVLAQAISKPLIGGLVTPKPARVVGA